MDLTQWLRLSTQVALLGEVTANMHAVTVGVREGNLVVRCYYYTEPTEDDIEHLQFVGTETYAAAGSWVGQDAWVYEEPLVLGDEKPEMLDFWAFMRAPEDAGDKA